MKFTAVAGLAFVATVTGAQAQTQTPMQQDMDSGSFLLIDHFSPRFFCYHGDQRHSVGARVDLVTEQSVTTQECQFVTEKMPSPDKFGESVTGFLAKWKTLPGAPPQKK